MVPRFCGIELVDRHRGGVRRGIAYGSEGERVNFDTESSDVLLLELSSQVALNESGLNDLVVLAMGLARVRRALGRYFPIFVDKMAGQGRGEGS